MILLDTHIWLWLVSDDVKSSQRHRDVLSAAEADGLGISPISCWEVAKSVESGRLKLTVPVGEWIDDAVAFPNIVLVPLTPRIAVESTQLPQPIQKDPGDQIIIATARVLGLPLITADARILAYPHVQTVR